MPRTPLFPARLCLLAMFSALVCADASLARIAAKDDPVTLQQTWNPKPDALDIELPMPCGLKMAFRAVAVPGEPGQEFPFMMGLANADRERRIYGERREGRIAGVFTANDLPIAWRSLLERSKWRDHTVYLIGKYEVSQAQWDAVMNGTCPAPEPPKPGMWDRLRGKKPDAPAAGASLPASAALPVREISWTDMQTFLGKYNDWLLQQHKKQHNVLPVFVDNAKKTGFVRLPTEAEWEFAARGGMVVDQTTRENDAPFAVGRAEEYAVFAGKSRPTEPEPIGSRLPNALGLYDTAGNVKELMDNAFQRGGSTGGVLVKGGGFRNGENEVMPGWRDEASRHNKPNDQGFRLVLTGELTASARRMAALNVGEKGQRKEKPVQAVSVPAAEDWLAAERGDARAQFKLGEMYRLGRGVRKDEMLAVAWYRRAAEQGLAEAQFMLGSMYTIGRGVTKDDKLAGVWCRKSADQGFAAAQYLLGVMYEKGGGGLSKSASQAASWYRKAADQGDMDAQKKLGEMYYLGRGVSKDNKQAVAWYRRAAEQGLAEAQFMLGSMYLLGRGVTKDDKSAVVWCRKAADQDFVAAQYLLGVMYENGRGLPKNGPQAAYWYRKAAEQGDMDAKKALRRLGQ